MTGKESMNPSGRKPLFERCVYAAAITASFCGAFLFAPGGAPADPIDDFARAAADALSPLLARFPALPMAPVQPSPGPPPAPQASAAAVAAAVPEVPRGGPLQLSLLGSLSAGRSFSQSSFGAQTTASGTASDSLGMTAELQRHTAASSADLRVPVGVGNRGGAFGQPSIVYSRPKYELSYGQQQTSLFGVVAAGSTQRGYAMATGIRGGDVTYFGGSTAGVGGEGIRMAGARARRMSGRALYELSVVKATAGAFTGNSTTVSTGVATSMRDAALIFEAAFQTRQAPDGPAGGMAYGLRFDSGLGQNAATLLVSRTPDRYLLYGSGEVSGTSTGDLALRRSFGRTAVSLDVGRERTVGFGLTTTTSRETLTMSGALLGKEQYSLNLDSSKTVGDEPAQWNGSGQLQLAFPMRSGFAIAGAQFARTLSEGSEPASLAGYSGQIQKQFGGFSFSLGTQIARQSGGGAGVSRNQLFNAGITRNVGRTGFGLNYTLTRVDSPTSEAMSRTPLLLLTRQISPSLSVQTQYGTQNLTDALNPAANGRSRLFSIQLNAPFQFGNAGVQGRVDPHLPATIQGRVVSDLGNTPGLVSAAGSGGLGNVGIILDGQYVQRTDFSGNFQFSFVKPGPHQLRVDTATLPRGLSVDQPVVAANLEGGQTGSYYFRVGNYGAVYGHVLGRSQDGSTVPLANVLLRLDGGAYSQTDQQGNYGFGRLTAGDHTITVVENTVPAFAAFGKTDLERKLSISNGQIQTLDFIAQPLGSISGLVKYDPSVRPNYAGAVANAYVVAEPGEYAAIVGDDGSFIIDNVPPGTYSVSIDAETVPEELGQLQPDYSETLTGHERVTGVDFTVGHKLKHVVFSFVQGSSASALTVSLSEPKLPPLGTADVIVDAAATAGAVTVNAFGNTLRATYVPDRKLWVAPIAVPPETKPGSVAITASAGGKTGSTTLVVDPKAALATLRISTPNAQVGQYVAVRARFLVDAAAGDRIVWNDGQTTVLSKPVAGRIFAFSVHLTARPLEGTLFTKTAKVAVQI